MLPKYCKPCIIKQHMSNSDADIFNVTINDNIIRFEISSRYIAKKQKQILLEENIDRLKALLAEKTTTVAGPSGVGKSSLVNELQTDVRMQTGAISDKIGRGKHTTRHSEIISIGQDTYIMDTPGFSSMDLPGFEKEDLWTCYPEFVPYEPECRFIGCSHIGEPDCGVKNALAEGKISRVRYDNYVMLYDEMKNIRKY